MSQTPEHDKIDALRYSNPLATNLAHMLLNGRGWVLENKLTDPPVRIPVARIAAALLGVDANAYRRELDARFGIPTVPPTIADVVTEWSAESAVVDEIRALDEEVAARNQQVVSAAAAESPIAAAVAAGVPHLIADGTVLASPDPEVAPEHRGTLLGAAVSLGLLDNEEAASHPAFGVPLLPENFLGKPDLPLADTLASPTFDVPTPAVVDVPEFPATEPTWQEVPESAAFTVPTLTDLGQPEPALDVLAMPAFESGQEFVLPEVASVPPLAQTDWNVPTFGPTQFDDLGVTPPDAEFQFGSYDLDQDAPVDDFNKPLLAPSAYDVDAPVEGVAEAVGDAELAARRDEALSYLADNAAPSAADAVFLPPVDQPADLPAPGGTSPIALPAPDFDAPAFDDVVAGDPPADDVELVIEHRNFDLLNVPDGRFPTA